MKLSIAFLVGILAGIGIGWYFGYSRPVVRNQRELLKEYQYTRDNFHMTDAEMADFANHKAEYFEEMKRQDEMAAVIALMALEVGDTERAKKVLVTTVSSYYRVYSKNGNTNLIRHIVSYAATNSALSNAIYGKLQ